MIVDGALDPARQREAQMTELKCPHTESSEDPLQVLVATEPHLHEAEAHVVPEVVVDRPAGHVVFERGLPRP